MITINGVLSPDHLQPHGLISGMPVTTAANTTLKIAFQITTGVGPGLEFLLCAGSMDDFNNGVAGLVLASVAAPGRQTLTIVDTDTLAGKEIYILRQGTGVSPLAIHFTINVE